MWLWVGAVFVSFCIGFFTASIISGPQEDSWHKLRERGIDRERLEVSLET